MKLAVIEVAGKQYLVKKGDTIETEKLEAQVGEKVSLPRVLLTWDGKKLEMGRPYLKGYTAEVEVLARGKGPKVVAFKYKRRKDSRRKVCHRQIIFKVKFNTVTAPARKESAKAGEKAAPPAARKPLAPAKVAKKTVAPAKAKKAPAKSAKKPEPQTKKKSAPKTKPAAKKS